jgi:hypothetical protein
MFEGQLPNMLASSNGCAGLQSGSAKFHSVAGTALSIKFLSYFPASLNMLLKNGINTKYINSVETSRIFLFFYVDYLHCFLSKL